MQRDNGILESLIRKAPVKQDRKITVSDALNRVTDLSVSRALNAYDNAENPTEKMSTTIRLPSSVVEFYSVLADEFGISLQNAVVVSLIGLIENEIKNI